MSDSLTPLVRTPLPGTLSESLTGLEDRQSSICRFHPLASVSCERGFLSREVP